MSLPARRGIPDCIRAGSGSMAVLPWRLDVQEMQFPTVRPAGMSVSASFAKGRAFRLMCVGLCGLGFSEWEHWDCSGCG